MLDIREGEDKDTNAPQKYCDDHDWWVDRGTECKYCVKDREFADDISRHNDLMFLDQNSVKVDENGFFDFPPTEMPKTYIPADSASRKNIPLATGLLDYFRDALAAVAEVSKIGNDKHNPGEPMHHARGKSMDHADCIMRHLAERGGFDGDTRHSAALAWRALALLQEELERELGLTLPRGAKAAT